MRGARLGRYALWQMRDYALERGAPTLLVAALLGYVTVAPMLSKVNAQLATMPLQAIGKYGSIALAHAALVKELNEPFIRTVLGSIVYLGALLAMNGVVASDRNKGYYRFLFSKPVSPLRYYGQLFLLHWAGFVAVCSMLALVYGLFISPILSASLVTVIAAMFLLYAGIIFVLSASFKGDWLLLILVTVLSILLWERFGGSSSIFAKGLYLLPPLHRTTEIYNAVGQGNAMNRQLLEWFAGYGAICYLAGLVVLRLRRLAIV